MMIFFFRGTRGGKGDLLNILKIIDFFFKLHIIRKHVF